MYEGFSKNNGNVIGDTSQGCENVDISEAQESTAAEESLVCMNEEGEELVLNAQLDTDTGSLRWCQLYDKDTVMRRTVGMSQMTSMMRDMDRNNVYNTSIGKLIDHFVKEHDRHPIILDIGTGTGLLSMFSASKGAEFVFGIEMFDAMASIAERVVGSNDFTEKILVINAKSSEIEDLPAPPDLLVSELLDSALLGEGCIPAHTDALSRLINQEGLDGDFRNRVIPYSGAVYATLIESMEVNDMHDVGSIRLAAADLHPHRTDASADPPACKGGWSVVPVHWTEMLSRGARELSTATQVLHPNFVLYAGDGSSAEEKFSTEEEWYYTDVTATNAGMVHGVLMWWTLYLLSPEIDPARECTYSTASGAQNWQDHWQQTVYPLPEGISVSAGEVVRVYAKHDSVQIQIYAEKVVENSSEGPETPDSKRARQNSAPSAPQVESMVPCGGELPDALLDDCRTLCMCGWHVLCGAERFQSMCDACKGQTWQAALAETLDALPTPDGAKGVVLDLSDGSLLGLSAAKKLQSVHRDSRIKVVSKETKLYSRMFFGQVAGSNGLDDGLLVWDGQDLGEIADFLSDEQESDVEDDTAEEVAVMTEAEGPDGVPAALVGSVVGVASECYYYQLHALPTWQALSFYYQVQSLRRQGLLHSQCRVLPGRALIKAAVFELPNLSRCHGLAGT